MKPDFNLNKHVARLLMDEPFFASLSLRVEKIATNSIPTAGVRINPESATFDRFYKGLATGFALCAEHT